VAGYTEGVDLMALLCGLAEAYPMVLVGYFGVFYKSTKVECVVRNVLRMVLEWPVDMIKVWAVDWE